MRRSRCFVYGIFVFVLIWCILFQLEAINLLNEFFTDLFSVFDASTHIKKFFQQTPALHDRLLLIDKNLLKFHLEHNPYDYDVPCLFCRVSRYQPVTFGLITPGNRSLEEMILLPILRAWEAGFWVEQIIYSKYTKFSPIRPNLPLGFVLQKGGGAVIIEIVLLHEREGDFWWHGSLEQDFNSEEKLDNLKITDGGKKLALSAQGAYDKVRFETVVIDGLDINLPLNIRDFVKTPTTFIECNYERADRFHRLNGKDLSPKANLFRHRATKLLAAAQVILDNMDIPFWISSGTLLGYYRQCDIIPYSQDVDIGIFIKHYNVEMTSAFTSRGFRLKHKFGKMLDGLELSFAVHTVKLDIFFFYEEDDFMWNGGHGLVSLNGKLHSGTKYRYKFPKFTLCWTEFLMLKVQIPCETEQYITANYGPNWFYPRANWDWAKDPYNVEKVGEWSPDEVEEVLQIF